MNLWVLLSAQASAISVCGKVSRSEAEVTSRHPLRATHPPTRPPAHTQTQAKTTKCKDTRAARSQERVIDERGYRPSVPAVNDALNGG